MSAQVGKPISAIVNEIRSTANSYPAMCYRMATEGGRKFVVPLAFKDKLNWMGRSYWSTGLMVQNLNTTSNASVTVTCYAADGTQAGSASYTVSPQRSKVVFPLPITTTDFLGSVVVTADQDVAVAVNHIVSGSTEDTAMSHTGIKR
ncbi:MAG: hypothetical protein H5T64_09715 [Chloroflexi bacterium]|nr:hypothetical protein [Chloroflexota bacterium]